MINSIFKHAIFSLAVAISLTTTLVKNCEARPYRGGIPVSFLLCKFSDSPTPPNDPTYYRNMTIASGTKSLNDYIKAISYGKADLSGSVVHGWYTEAHTLAYEQKLTNRWQRVQDCLDTAANSSTDRYVPPSGHGDGPPVQTLNINGVTITVKNMSGNQSTVEISTKLAHQNPITYGPNTCQNGYVWRDGDDSDYVCVLPKIRTQTAYDNSQAANRRSPNGGTFGADTCKQGYVWREAWTGDHVCVTPATRSQAQSDNSQATQRLWNQQALLPEEPGQRFAILPALKKVKYIAAALKDIAEAPKTEPESPPPVSESVLRVRLTKLGYTEVRSLVHNGNNWDATVVMKNGVSHLIHFHAQTGRVIEKARVQP